MSVSQIRDSMPVAERIATARAWMWMSGRAPGQARWVAAQEHSGENIGDTPSHAIFIELKKPAGTTALGPSLS